MDDKRWAEIEAGMDEKNFASSPLLGTTIAHDAVWELFDYAKELRADNKRLLGVIQDLGQYGDMLKPGPGKADFRSKVLREISQE